MSHAIYITCAHTTTPITHIDIFASHISQYSYSYIYVQAQNIAHQTGGYKGNREHVILASLRLFITTGVTLEIDKLQLTFRFLISHVTS